MPIFILLLLLCLGGCATTTEHQPGPFQAPVHRGLAEDPTVERPFLVEDPWEGFNRSMYHFNAKFDRYVYLPVVGVYEQVLPDSVQNGISNIFNNLKEIPIFVNSCPAGQGQESLGFPGTFCLQHDHRPGRRLRCARQWGHSAGG
jgi:Surface lipoprotein